MASYLLFSTPNSKQRRDGEGMRMQTEMHVLEVETPHRRLASPRRLISNHDEDEQPLLRSRITSPRRTNAAVGAAPFSSFRTVPSIVFIAMACLIFIEYIMWRAGTGSLIFSTVSPCDARYTSNDGPNKTELDFAILGFPKTGTTFLIYALEQHPQVVMPPDGTAPMEFCQIHHPRGHKELVNWIKNASSTETAAAKYGIKCPTMVRSMNAIENLMKVSDRTKLIVGVRHPILWFQSFYNYRVSENHADPDRYPEPIPSPFTLNKNKEWRDVTTAYARFDSYLKQLMKVPLRGDDLRDMLRTDAFWEKRIQPNPYKVFIYTSEQLNDKNATRQTLFRDDLQHFLGLETPLVDFNTMPEVNKNDASFDEYIDICNSTYTSIRKELLAAGLESSRWIIDKFIRSEDVVVGNRKYFVEHLRSWRVDPCKK